MPGIKELISNIESDECTTREDVLHRLLKLAMAVTGKGTISEDYTKTIEFPIGGAFIQSDSYYQRIWISTGDIEIEIEDAETIKQLSDEVRKRLLEFDKNIRKTRKTLAEQVFSKQMDQITEVTGIREVD